MKNRNMNNLNNVILQSLIIIPRKDALKVNMKRF
jgi:hypothetical protein